MTNQFDVIKETLGRLDDPDWAPATPLERLEVAFTLEGLRTRLDRFEGAVRGGFLRRRRAGAR